MSTNASEASADEKHMTISDSPQLSNSSQPVSAEVSTQQDVNGLPGPAGVVPSELPADRPTKEDAAAGGAKATPPLRAKVQTGARRGESGMSRRPGPAARPISRFGGEGRFRHESGRPAPAASDAAPSRSAEADSEGEMLASETEALEALTRDRVKPVVPPPSRHGRLTAELEREINDAMAGMSLDAIADSGSAEVLGDVLEPDSRLRGRVVRIQGDHVFFSLGGRDEGVVSLRLFREPPSLGDEMDVVVRRYHAEDGLYELSVPGESIKVSGWSDLAEGAIVEARITGANTGGLECMVNTIRGFIPASQIGIFRVEDFAEYIGQKLSCVVTEVNRKRKNLVLSHRAVMEREKEQARRQLLEELQPGQTREGVVRSIQDFGAFVDLGGVDGLIHISQLSWDRVQHPSEVLQEGQQVRVKIERVNPETGKISLSYRDLLEHPWATVEERFPVGTVVKGAISRIAKFGAFVKLASGVEGLIHISELAYQRVRAVGDVVAEGQEVEVKVLGVDVAAQRIALSLKAALPEPPPEEKPLEEPQEPELQREPTVARRKRTLRGGFDRPSGGEQFGLKW